MSRKETPYFGGEKGDKLTKILPKSVHNIHEDFKNIIREMYEESLKDFESRENSRLTYEEREKTSLIPL